MGDASVTAFGTAPATICAALAGAVAAAVNGDGKLREALPTGGLVIAADCLPALSRASARPFDIRVIVPQGAAAALPRECVDDAISEIRRRFLEAVPYVSTRGKSSPTFLGAILEGLATDGGLYVPGQAPTGANGLPRYWLRELVTHASSLSYASFACVVLERLVDLRQVGCARLEHMVHKAYEPARWSEVDICAVRSIPSPGGQQRTVYTSEQFHGPTAAFKDFALQLFPQFFAEAVAQSDQRDVKYAILTATSGDTGVAAINGFRYNAPEIPIMVLYPTNGVSPVQRQQMLACHGGSVNVLPVNGDFDCCQRAVKSIFNDATLQGRVRSELGYKFSSANSINWGRLLPQLVYYVWTYAKLVEAGAVDAGRSELDALECFEVAVPTGNFGNVLAAYYARIYLGLPIDRFIIASNSNDILHDFIASAGTYDTNGRSLVTTASPSIDILRASNVERFLWLATSHDAEITRRLMDELDSTGKFVAPPTAADALRRYFTSARCSEIECGAALNATLRDSAGKTLLDPHTAVGLHALAVTKPSTRVAVLCSTAHWAKFPEPVLKWLQSDPLRVNPGDALEPTNSADIPALYARVKQLVPSATVAAPLAQIFETASSTQPKNIVEPPASSGNLEDIVAALWAFIASQH